MVDFIQSPFFNIISFVFGGIFGFFSKRLHIRYTHYQSALDELKKIMAEVKAGIIKTNDDPFVYIIKHDSEVAACIENVCSHISKRKGNKLRQLYKDYYDHKDNDDFNVVRIDRISRFDKIS